MKKNILTLNKLSKIALGGIFIASTFMLSACKGNSNEEETISVEEVKPTKGVITEIEEGKDGEFKIISEKTIANPDESKAIVHYADGKVDTLNSTQVKNEIEKAPSSHAGTGFLSGILMYSLMSRFMGGGMNSNFVPNPNAYKTPEAYNQANQTNNEVNRTATRTVRTIKNPKSGFGSKSSSTSRSGFRSTRSYGG
ncbi:hypothetical protein ETU08_06425 [Apibacter muscae]|uniref:hypothetical protein n=1 Tax=Apibacter muscae TaxID=2509004 RepID=UPI0011ADFA41|nr:hypothetical protein [Apibacter muscae]TWP24233.1 hypothetical protein ETU10_03045 [Apibacter muscae]TWP30190.1 hypothetical protein ETU08_06425 [Apibacter muscae]